MTRTGMRAGGVRSLVVAALSGCTWLLAIAAVARGAPPAETPLRRAIVPAGAPEQWPEGDWIRIPDAEFAAFARDYENGDLISEGPPLIDRLVLRAALSEGTLIEGRFEAQVRRLAPQSAFLDLGRPTGAIRNLQWVDGAAVWGTAPDTRMLLQVDRAAGTVTGDWSQRGESSPVGSEFDVQTFPAASIRLEIALPAEYELQSTRGIVLPPGTGGTDERVWAIELGQHSGCLCTVVRRSDLPPIVTMSVERTASWTIRPDGCRLHADFNVSIPATAPATLEFEIPDGLSNPEVTTSANVSLPVEIDRRSSPPRLVVPLPRLAAGRLGIIRVSGDLPLRERDDWDLPDVRLENSTMVSSLRRIHVDRPLKLLSFELQGARQSGINIDDAGGDWTFEDTAADARVTVRIGQPPAALVVRAVTLVELLRSEARFRTAAELRSLGGGEYSAELQLPAGWNVIEVGPAAGDRTGLTSWRARESSAGIRLEIAFRQALSAQAPRYVLISGRRVGSSSADRDIELFPQLTSQDDVRSWLGIRAEAAATGALTPQDGAQRFVAADGTADWNRLLTMLGVEAADSDWTWFAQSGTAGDGAVSLGTPSSPPPDQPGGSSTAVSSGNRGPDRGPYTLDLLLVTDPGGPDSDWSRHRADYALNGRLPEQPPQIRLPAGAQFDGVDIDGRPQNVVVAGDVVELLDWPDAARRVEVRYRTRNAGSGRSLTRDVVAPLPEWERPPRTVEWRLQISNGERLAGVHVPHTAVEPRPRDGWLQRVFGPLARDDWRRTANPFSTNAWLRRFAATPEDAPEGAGVIRIGTSTSHGELRVEMADVRRLERAGWLAVLGALLTAASLRLCSRRGAAIAWCAILVLLPAASLLPYATAILSGSALAGALIGVLLPRRWIAPLRAPRGLATAHPDRPRAGTAIGASLLLLCAWNPGLKAQASPSEQPRSGSATAEPAPAEFDVLLPEDAGRAVDHVLLQRRLLPQFEQWRRVRRQAPAYLLQSGEYLLKLGDAPEVRARFRVAVIDRRAGIPLVLPFDRVWVLDPDACRVDGQPAQIRPATSMDALLVQLEPAASTAASETRMSDVELSLRLSTAARTDSGWEFAAPRLLDTQLTLAEAAAGWTADSHQSARLDGEGRPVYAPGGRATIAVRPEGAPMLMARRTLSAQAVSLIEVHPLRLRVRTSLIPSITRGERTPAGPRRLRLQLPERSDVREVAVSGLRGYAVRHPRRDLTYVDLELDPSPEPDAPIHLDFTIPVEQPQQAIVIPSLTLLGDGRLSSHRIGLRGSQGILLDPPSPSELPASVSEIPAAMFSAGLDTGAAWPIPSHVYVAATPTALTVSSRAAASEKSVALKQSVSINAGSLHWEATADIDVGNVPAYQHVFQLSPEVQLDEVQLTQDDVGRLLDWSHDGGRLVMFLAGDRIGRQQIRLSGTLDFDPDGVTPFPGFGMQEAAAKSSELIVRSLPGQSIELFAADGTPIPADYGTTTGSAMQFSQPDAELPAAFRILPAPAPLPVHVLTTIDRSDGVWQLLTEVVPERALAPGESIAFEVPPEFVETITPLAPAVIMRAADGGLRLAISSDSAAEADARLAFLMPLTVPEQGEWQAPRTRFPGATVVDDLAVISPAFPRIPAPSAAVPADPETWPPSLRLSRIATEGNDPFAVYRWTGSESRFEQRRSADRLPEVRLTESTVWRDADGTVGGETTFWLIARQPQCELQFDSPAGSQFQSAAWDGQPVAPRDISGDGLALRIDGLAPGSAHCLRLGWTASSGAAGEIREPGWPHPTNAPRIAVVLPRDGYVLMPPRLQPARAETLQLRIDALLGLYAAAGPVADTPALGLLAREIDALLPTLDGQAASLTGPNESRWETLRANLAGRTATADDGAGARASLMSIACRDARTLLLDLTADDGSIRFWELHAGLSAIAACVAALLAIAVCMRFRRTGVSRAAWRAINPEAVRVLALGTLWWMWLKFGLVALLLIGSSAWLQRRARRQVDAPSPDLAR